MYAECFLGEFIFKYVTYMYKMGFLAKFHYHVSGKFLRIKKSFRLGRTFQQ